MTTHRQTHDRVWEILSLNIERTEKKGTDNDPFEARICDPVSSTKFWPGYGLPSLPTAQSSGSYSLGHTSKTFLQQKTINEYDTAELECQEENREIPPCDTMVNCLSRELRIFNKII